MKSLIDYKNIKEEDYNLIGYFLKFVFENQSEKQKLMMSGIYKRIDGEFDEDEIYYGKILFNIINLLKNSEICLNCDDIVKSIGSNSRMKTVVILGKLAREELVYKILEKRTTYYGIAPSFDKQMENICARINLYINAYNLVPVFKCDSYTDITGEHEYVVKDIEKEIDELLQRFKIKDKNHDSLKVFSDNSKIIEYMKNIVEVENDIYSLKQRYFSLNKFRQNCISLNNSLSVGSLFSKCVDFENKINIYDEKEEKNNIEIEEPSLDYFLRINSVNKPIFNVKKPMKPILRKAGLFNKKKVERENFEKVEIYKKKIEKFKLAQEQYDIALQNYEKEKDKMYKKANKQYQNALRKYEEEVIKKNTKLKNIENNKKKMINSFKNEINDLLLENQFFKKVKAINYEMAYIEKCLEKVIELKQELYSYNIIYGKYRNFIALSTFIDYFMSGRCDSLEGRYGAYNLFEEETRSNIIINKLDIIIKKIDQVIENQYYVCNKLNEVNDSLKNIQNELLVTNFLQTVEISKLSDIIDKADEIAYNTKVTSYYAEKTSKYAEMLTYINFLNCSI